MTVLARTLPRVGLVAPEMSIPAMPDRPVEYPTAEPVDGVPDVKPARRSGLLEVTLHPRLADNQLV